MTGVAECKAAIARASERINEVDEVRRRRHIRERTVSIVVPDLDTVFDMRLTFDGLEGVTTRNGSAPTRKAHVHITVSSDDLVEIAEDRLGFSTALLSGRVKVNASISDMMRLRKLL